METEDVAHPAVAEFAHALRELRRTAGNPSFNDLAKQTGVPRSTLHDAVSGRRLPAQKVVLSLVAALDGDVDAWRERWVESDKARRPEPVEPVEPPEPGRPGWFRAHRTAVLIAVATAVVAAGVAIPIAVSAMTSVCSEVRDYVVTARGAVLDAKGTTVGQVAPGDHLHARTLAHGPFAHRRLGEVVGSGESGYVDESKIDYQGTVCG